VADNVGKMLKERRNPTKGDLYGRHRLRPTNGKGAHTEMRKIGQHVQWTTYGQPLSLKQFLGILLFPPVRFRTLESKDTIAVHPTYALNAV
jgi:hypothetical protein